MELTPEQKQEVKEALDYLKTGGLGEVEGLARQSQQLGAPQVKMDTAMAIALCLMASGGDQDGSVHLH